MYICRPLLPTSPCLDVRITKPLFQQAEDYEALVESIMPLKKFWSSMRHSQSAEACPARRSFQIARRRFGIVALAEATPLKILSFKSHCDLSISHLAKSRAFCM